MILAALSLVHGDERMELMYLIASLMIVALPVSTFIAMAWWLARKYFRERRVAAAAAQNAPGPSPPPLPPPGDVG